MRECNNSLSILLLVRWCHLRKCEQKAAKSGNHIKKCTCQQWKKSLPLIATILQGYTASLLIGWCSFCVDWKDWANFCAILRTRKSEYISAMSKSTDSCKKLLNSAESRHSRFGKKNLTSSEDELQCAFHFPTLCLACIIVIYELVSKTD